MVAVSSTAFGKRIQGWFSGCLGVGFRHPAVRPHDAKRCFLQLTSRREETHVVHAQNHCTAERSRGAAGPSQSDPYCYPPFRKRPSAAAALSRRSGAGGVRARLLLGRRAAIPELGACIYTTSRGL